MPDRKERNSQEESFTSEYCHVEFVPEDNVVLLTWKKFCRLEDYRTPTMVAAYFLKKHRGSNFIIDARDGFEDDKEDVQWGFSVLLPLLAQSDCKVCVFILREVSGIEGEIDLWTREFVKYFEVRQALSYAQAVEQVRKYNA